MAGKIPRLGIVLALILLFGATALAFSSSGLGVTSELGTGGLPLSTNDVSAIPQSVVGDATGLAAKLFGNHQEGCKDFANQLLATYLKAKDENFVIFFNSGGWGSTFVEADPDWHSIIDGIESDLATFNYKCLVLSYQRNANSLRGRFNELAQQVTGYPSEAKDFASGIDFLTAHIPNLRVIIAGESTGTVICDRVMSILKDNPQVYSIQTGPPFWHREIVQDRTLVITDNGIVPDSFSQGNFLAIIRANLNALFSLSRPEGGSGKIPKYVGAPGHDYRWQDPGVYSKITEFLDENFVTEQ